MKYSQRFLLFIPIVFFTFSFNKLTAQKECKVLIENLKGTYEGKCKKGLAHGKGKAVGIDTYAGSFSKGLPNGRGTYTWENGDKYTGQWRQGKRTGEGILVTKINEKDSIFDGLWENDKYKGPKPIPPKVHYSHSVTYRITKNGDNLKRVLIDFKQNGMRNVSIQDVLISSSQGSETQVANKIGFRDTKFPIRVKLTYTTENKTKTGRYKATIDFEIFEPGDWEVELTN